MNSETYANEDSGSYSCLFLFIKISYMVSSDLGKLREKIFTSAEALYFFVCFVVLELNYGA